MLQKYIEILHNSHAEVLKFIQTTENKYFT